jgi:4-azaleucine resistance transporter AzlC
MSALVLAGAAQFVALGLWVSPLPTLAILLTTLVVNARHLLMGAALRPWLARLSARKTYASAFFLSDESWALTLRQFATEKTDGAFLLGSGLALFAAWTGATLLGRVAGTALGDPARWGLDFTFTALIVALLIGMWKGKSSLLPWITAALVAVATAHWLPGKWYILLGGIAGSLIGAVRDAR